ncbi:MAG: hypothetical protein B6I20_11265, partial [Bacteroidetes bacterium 4572_117]
GSAYENALSSFFGRVNYNFDEKYLLEFNIRRDGSSRMPEENRYGIFPSFSAGWILSNESFLSSSKSLSFLKLRGSWGQLGNQEIGEYAYSQSFNTGHNYVIDGSLVGGIAISELANPNITWEKTTITDIGLDMNLFDDKITVVADWFDKTSSPIGSFYGLVADGYLAESDFDIEGNLNDGIATQYGDLKPGDIKYRDISGPDGEPDGVISEDYDREIVGNPFPDFTYGFTIGAGYKGFDLSMFFQGANGVDRWQWYNNEADGNYTEAILDYWTPTNTAAAYPSLGNSDNNSKWSSFWIEDASYLRLKNLEIGYTLPKTISERVKISRARIYFTGYNLLTFTKMPDYDPERRADDVRAGSYAQTKVFSFGLNLTF